MLPSTFPLDHVQKRLRYLSSKPLVGCLLHTHNALPERDLLFGRRVFGQYQLFEGAVPSSSQSSNTQEH